jgi:hypothetical protein
MNKTTTNDGCDLCSDNKGPMFLHARCHMTAPLQASIEDGILTLRCYLPNCRRVVTQMPVMQAPSAEILTEGMWRPCTGCYEQHAEDHPSERWNAALGCYLGTGCRECGGFGAVWWSSTEIEQALRHE